MEVGMANRSIQQKIRKLKRFRRFARFSGETSKFTTARDTGIIDKDGKHIYVPVGPVSLSSQAPKSKGPNRERMQQYYNSVKPDSFTEPIKPRSDSELVEWLANFDILKKVSVRSFTIAHTRTGRLDLYAIEAKEWVLVEWNYTEEYVRRSRMYDDKKTALDRLKNKRVTWVETMSPQHRLPKAT